MLFSHTVDILIVNDKKYTYTDNIDIFMLPNWFLQATIGLLVYTKQSFFFSLKYLFQKKIGSIYSLL